MSCLLPYLRDGNYAIKKHDTISNSIIIYAKDPIDDQDVVLKLSTESTKDDNMLEIERKMYAFVYTELMHWSPHFLVPLHIGSCRDRELEEEKNTHRALLRAWNNLRQQALLPKKLVSFPRLFRTIYYVITPRMKGMSLADFFDEKDPSFFEPMPRILQVVALQLAQALTVLGMKRVMHNDLHFGNVFIEIHKDIQTIEYHYPRKTKLRTRYVVKIFDWDRGSAPDQKLKNIGLDTQKYCRSMGECNLYIAKFDWYTALNMLVTVGVNNDNLAGTQEFKRILGKLYVPFNNNYDAKVGKDGFFGLPCTCTKVVRKFCIECTPRSLYQLTTPRTYFMQHIRQFETL